MAVKLALAAQRAADQGREAESADVVGKEIPIEYCQHRESA